MFNISNTITRKLSIKLKSTPRVVHITVHNKDGEIDSTVHCGLDVAKFNYLNTNSTEQFIKCLSKNGVDINKYASTSLKEIHDAYNAVLSVFVPVKTESHYVQNIVIKNDWDVNECVQKKFIVLKGNK